MPKINNEDNINLEPIRFTHKYLNSKGFRKRLQNVPAKQRKEYARNIAENANRDINLMQTYPERRSILGAIGNAIRGIFDDRYLNYYAPSAYSKNNIISISADYTDKDKAISPDKDFIIAHEYGHKIDPVDRKINIYKEASNAPENFQQIHRRKRIEDNNWHDKAYAETYADLNATRYDLYKNDIYDITKGEDFTEDDYNNYIEYLKKNNKNNRLIDQFDKDDVIELMNTIAQNNNERRSLEDYYNS